MDIGSIGGLLGGSVALIVALTAFMRVIFRQIKTTEDNTRALENLNRTVERMLATQNRHGEDLAALKAIVRNK